VNFQFCENNKAWGLVKLKNKGYNLKKNKGENLKTE
jgi:hypothetical protein